MQRTFFMKGGVLYVLCRRVGAFVDNTTLLTWCLQDKKRRQYLITALPDTKVDLKGAQQWMLDSLGHVSDGNVPGYCSHRFTWLYVIMMQGPAMHAPCKRGAM
jgi:hypothetical protein